MGQCKNISFVSFLLRIGIALVFLYAATASLLQPYSWIGYFPLWLRNAISPSLLLTLFSIYEILLAFWILSGKFAFYSSLLAALTMLAIIIGNITLLDVLFRDIAIFFSAVALATIHYKDS
ncbi:MAG: hypothetical protein HYW78_02015 [Parcubacteria group bacterium]|nr:hypothetical protein [Parcubacteria group bacterium]